MNTVHTVVNESAEVGPLVQQLDDYCGFSQTRLRLDREETQSGSGDRRQAPPVEVSDRLRENIRRESSLRQLRFQIKSRIRTRSST